jgi:hypothetical protein
MVRFTTPAAAQDCAAACTTFAGTPHITAGLGAKVLGVNAPALGRYWAGIASRRAGRGGRRSPYTGWGGTNEYLYPIAPHQPADPLCKRRQYSWGCCVNPSSLMLLNSTG